MLPGAAGVTEAGRAAERVRAAIDKHDWSAIADDLSVTVSIGVAVSERLEPVDALLERADRGLQRAKEEGRNRSELGQSETELEQFDGLVEQLGGEREAAHGAG